MKKGLLFFGLAIIIIAIYFLFFYEKKEKPHGNKLEALKISKNSESFNQQFNAALQEYYALSSALVNWDSLQANKAAENLKPLITKVPYDSLQADSILIATAKNFAENIAFESEALIKATNIEEKRRHFYTISDFLYSLIRTVKYDQEVIYHMKCPMAFNDSETAYWLSNSPEIINPYLGNKHPKYHSGMLHCGNIEDSIAYAEE